MSKYTQQQETEIIREAMELTAAIKLEEEELQRLRDESFANKPAPPQRTVLQQPKEVKPNYPQTPKYTIGQFLNDNRALMILGIIGVPFIFFGGVGIPILIFIMFRYKTKAKQVVDEANSNPDYQRAIAQAEKDAQEANKTAEENYLAEQKRLDSEYEANFIKYNSDVLPKYEAEFAKWQTLQKRKIDAIESDLRLNKETLTNLYDTSRLVSVSYRELWILNWLYNDMSSSDHDVRYATELLDRDRQRLVTQEAGRIATQAIGMLNQTMTEGFGAVYNAIESGSEEHLRQLKTMRRDMNIGTAIGAVQRNKAMKLIESIKVNF